jgi:hypothetical protein
MENIIAFLQIRIGYLIIFILSVLTNCIYAQNTEIKGLIIDPKIKTEAKKHIKESAELDAFKNIMQVYFTSAIVESYENDVLIFNSADTSKRSVFKSYYHMYGDTLRIVGAFGIWGGIGFSIKIHNNQATLSHMLNSDDFPSYAYNEKDSLIWQLEVPCTDTKIILSEIPDTTKGQVIYGYVEFKSGNYYTGSDGTNGTGMQPRSRQRNNMKVYFKSGPLKLP